MSKGGESPSLCVDGLVSVSLGVRSRSTKGKITGIGKSEENLSRKKEAIPRLDSMRGKIQRERKLTNPEKWPGKHFKEEKCLILTGLKVVSCEMLSANVHSNFSPIKF